MSAIDDRLREAAADPPDDIPQGPQGDFAEGEWRDATEALAGCLLGAAVGDALGLPRERLSRSRGLRLFGPAPLHHQFLGHRGMMSDDTEQACLTAQSLLESRGDVDEFAHSLARQLQMWALGGPAGIGRTTLRALMRLWMGYPPHRSGVPSASNDVVMRAPVIGVYAADDTEHLRALVRASTILTHSDPRAEQCSLLIALAAQQAAIYGPVADAAAFLTTLRPYVTDAHLGECMATVAAHLTREASAQELADVMGMDEGVSGFVNDTVPIALFCWLRYPNDFRQAVEEAILLGGDTDTTGAIVGALAATGLGVQAIPMEWLRGLFEWPRSITWMRQLATLVAGSRWPGEAGPPLRPCYPAVLPRNLLFAAVVLYHAGRRLFPPF